MLSNTLFSTALKAIITSKEPLLKARLEGGISPIRNDEFITNNFKSEDLIEPSDGLYDVNKKIDEWALENMPAPGTDMDEFKKKIWKKTAEENATQISKQVADWLKEDVIPDLAIAINTQIKQADITITVPPTSVMIPTPAGTAPTITGAPIPPTNVQIT